jgi:hypothetical protein
MITITITGAIDYISHKKNHLNIFIFKSYLVTKWKIGMYLASQWEEIRGYSIGWIGLAYRAELKTNERTVKGVA